MDEAGWKKVVEAAPSVVISTPGYREVMVNYAAVGLMVWSFCLKCDGFECRVGVLRLMALH